MTLAAHIGSLDRGELSRLVWDLKYRHREGDRPEQDVEDTLDRVARAIAAPEHDAAGWERRFRDLLDGFRFLPGGRILAGAGLPHHATLCNCFVMGAIEDSMEGIFDALREGAVTMQRGGGVGYDFSTLRPRGSPAVRAGTIASGPVSFMRVWDGMCSALLSSAPRRGAMMATLRCDHPDIEEFITAKLALGELSNFNLSVLVSDEFLLAIRHDDDWELRFPASPVAGGARNGGERATVTARVVRARDLWRRLLEAAYETGDPGVLFIDRINRLNNLWYRERLTATNPCGEVPLPPYGACNLGSVNLAAFVVQPFTAAARLDLDGIAALTRVACRFLDNVIDVSPYPLDAQRVQAQGSRRIGLGITGLADAFLMLGLTYGGERSVELAGEIARTLCHAAYAAAVELAEERGPFPFLDAELYLRGDFVRHALPDALLAAIRRHGIRNSHLLAVAPAGTISLLAGGVSNGIEPVFAFTLERTIRGADGEPAQYRLSDPAWHDWRQLHGETAELPECFVTAAELPPRAHLEVQAAVQRWVDGAVSKTVNLPGDLPFSDFETLFFRAYDLGLKGCTTFRANPARGAVLGAQIDPGGAHCCSIEREAD